MEKDDLVDQQIQLEAKAWHYLTRRQKDELLDKILKGGISCGYIEP